MCKNWSWGCFAFQLLPTGKNLTYVFIYVPTTEEQVGLLFLFSFPLYQAELLRGNFPIARCMYFAQCIGQSWICIINTKTYHLCALWYSYDNLLHHDQLQEQNAFISGPCKKKKKEEEKGKFFFFPLWKTIKPHFGVTWNNSAHFRRTNTTKNSKFLPVMVTRTSFWAKIKQKLLHATDPTETHSFPEVSWKTNTFSVFILNFWD